MIFLGYYRVVGMAAGFPIYFIYYFRSNITNSLIFCSILSDVRAWTLSICPDDLSLYDNSFLFYINPLRYSLNIRSNLFSRDLLYDSEFL